MKNYLNQILKLHKIHLPQKLKLFKNSQVDGEENQMISCVFCLLLKFLNIRSIFFFVKHPSCLRTFTEIYVQSLNKSLSHTDETFIYKKELCLKNVRSLPRISNFQIKYLFHLLYYYVISFLFIFTLNHFLFLHMTFT